jgi:hypothetical protein
MADLIRVGKFRFFSILPLIGFIGAGLFSGWLFYFFAVNRIKKEALALNLFLYLLSNFKETVYDTARNACYYIERVKGIET